MRSLTEDNLLDLIKFLTSKVGEDVKATTSRGILDFLSKKNLFNRENHAILRDSLKTIGKEKIYDDALSVYTENTIKGKFLETETFCSIKPNVILRKGKIRQKLPHEAVLYTR